MPSYETLLVCLGAQKAGTTWLWHYLRDHPQCAATPLKEIHFFGGKSERLNRLLAETTRAIPDAKTPQERLLLEEKRDFINRALEVFAGEERTAEVFEALVASAAKPGARVVAEFTPANCKLSLARLKQIADLPAAPKFVMTLRDPVDRLWSQIRMLARRQDRAPDRMHAVAMDIMERFLDGQEDAVPTRHDYAGMLRRARNAIPPERLFVEFFETFFDQPRIDAFCDFLGIDHRTARLDEPRAAGLEIPLPTEDRIRLRNRLAEHYAAVEKDLGTLPARWRETLAL